MSLEKRDQFLLHLYDNLWDSIDRSESGVWQFVGLNAALFAVVVLIYTEKLPVEVAGFFGLVVVFWGVNIVINAGWWFNHNLNYIQNIEQQFLNPDDYGRILPEYYKEKRIGIVNTLNAIHLVAFVALGIGLLIVTWTHWMVYMLAVPAAGLTVCHYLVSRKKLVDFANNTDPTSQ